MASRATTDPIEILLEMGVDLDNLSEEEDYLSALMEATNALTIKNASDSRISILQKEIIKVRKKRKAADPNFKVKKTKISADSFKNKSSSIKALPGSAGGRAFSVKKTNVGSAIVKSDEEKEQNILEKILGSLNSIFGTLKKDQESKKKTADQERRKREKEKRKGKEDKLESGIFKGLAKAAKKILKPVEGILSRIIKFISTILIGKVLIAIVDWISDKDNEGKLNAIGRFLKDTWPAMLAGFLLFGSGLTGFVTGLLASLAGFTLRLGGALIKLAAAHPIAAALILGTGAAVVSALNNEKTREEENKKDDKNIVTPTETREKGEMPKGPQLMDETIRQRGFGSAFNSGGRVPGSGPNKDTIPAMLTPGEFVMSRGAVQKYGTDTLSSMNSMGGGTNRPMIRGGVTYANGGGGMTDKKQTLPSDQQRKMEERKNIAKGNSFTNMFGGKSKEKPNGGGGSLKNLTGQDYRDLAFIVSAEAQRGTDDEYGVSAAVLNRVADPAWPNTIKAVGSQAGQFEAVYKGFAKDDPELAAKLASAEGQAKIVEAMKMLKGRTDFKGTSEYGNMGKGDIKFSNRGNFYHYKEQIGKSDPPPTPLPSYYTKFIGTGGPAVSLSSTKASGSGSSSGGGSTSTSTKDGGSGLSGLEMLAKIVNAQNKFISSKETASLGSKPSPSAPPAPPIKTAPKVVVANSDGSSAQQTPISETASYVPPFPSAQPSAAKMSLLGITGTA